MNLFLDEHRKFLLLLKKHNVEFIIIGGYAVIYHGYERTTGDLDLWLKPDNDNRDNFIKALDDHGVVKNQLGKVSTLDFNSNQALHLGEKPNQVEILTFCRGLNFEEALKSGETIKIEETNISILSFDHLIETKMLLGRPQDLADIDKLKKVNRNKGV